MPEEIGTTSWSLQHYFGNHVGWARQKLLYPDDVVADFEGYQERFVSGLRKILDERLPESRGVTYPLLQELIAIAERKPWDDGEVIKELYKKFFELQKEPYDEGRFF